MRLLAFLLLLPALSFAQVPHAFNNGEVADADKINENFESINERINAFGPAPTEIYAGTYFHEILVDCEANPEALQTELGDWVALVDRLKVNIKGACQVTSGFDALKSIGESFRHVVIAGALINGGFEVGGGCANTSKIVSPGTVSLGTISGSLWLSCITFDAADGATVRSYGKGYVRFEAGVRTASEEQPLNLEIRDNSTFRTFYNNRIDDLLVRSQSLASFNITDIDIGVINLEGASMMSCRGCDNGSIEQVKLRQGSNMTFLIQGGGITIDTLEARERSQLNIELYPDENSNVTVVEQTFMDDSARYESVSGQ